MTSHEYEPSEADIFNADHGAIEYISGVSVMHHPDSTADFHMSDADEDPESVVSAAAKLMIEGLTLVIKSANPPEFRTQRKMHSRFQQAAPHLIATHHRLYRKRKIFEFSPVIKQLEPFPVLDEKIYKLFCRGTFDVANKLSIEAMMHGVSIDGRLEEFGDLAWSELASSMAGHPSGGAA